MLTCCSSFLLSLSHSSSFFCLHMDRRGEGEGQTMISDDVTSQGIVRTSALSTAASLILLNSGRYGRQCGDSILFIFYVLDRIRVSFFVCVCVCCSYLSGVVYWRASQVNDEVIYPMFPRGNKKCNYPLRRRSLPLCCSSLCCSLLVSAEKPGEIEKHRREEPLAAIVQHEQ